MAVEVYQDHGEDDQVLTVPSRWVKLPGTHVEILVDHVTTVRFRRGSPATTARVHGQTVQTVELPGEVLQPPRGDDDDHECPLPVEAPIGARYSCPVVGCGKKWKARRGEWLPA